VDMFGIPAHDDSSQGPREGRAWIWLISRAQEMQQQQSKR